MEINLAAIIFGVIVIIGILRSIPSWIRLSKLKEKGIITVAEITRIEQNQFDADDDNWYFQAKVADENGETTEINLATSIYRHYRGYEVGHKVRIRYYPGHIEDFEILPDDNRGS